MKLNDKMTPEDHLNQGLKLALLDLTVGGPKPGSHPRHDKAIAQFTELFQDSMTHVLEAHRYDDPKQLSDFCFAHVSDIQAISLNDPPIVLVQQLKKLQELAAVPQR